MKTCILLLALAATAQAGLLGCDRTWLRRKWDSFILNPNGDWGIKYYRSPTDCSYKMTAAPGKEMAFYCTEFRLPPSRGCRRHYLSVNGVKYCGTIKPKAAKNTATALNIQFHTDGNSDCRYNCWIRVKPLGSGLPATRTLSSGSQVPCDDSYYTYLLRPGTFTIKSSNPSYGNYRKYEDCTYSLKAADATDNISISCSKFDVDSANGNCDIADWLQVDGKKYCASGPKNVSRTGSLVVKWHSNSWAEARGYVCQVTVG